MAGAGQHGEALHLVGEVGVGRVEAEGEGGRAGDGAAVRGGGGEGGVVLAEEGKQEGGGPAGSEDEDVVVLHGGSGCCCCRMYGGFHECVWVRVGFKAGLGLFCILFCYLIVVWFVIVCKEVAQCGAVTSRHAMRDGAAPLRQGDSAPCHRAQNCSSLL